MNGEMHLVAFNVPWPADYGGVIDIYYRLKALHEAGVGVHLHCFSYGRSAATQLASLCKSVSYYRRNMSPLLHVQRRPFIVASRDNAVLRRRLMDDNLPVLLEGVHCCSLLEDKQLRSRHMFIVRAHNIEADYYSMLAATERNAVRRAYLALDAAKLRHYERVLGEADAVLSVTEADRRRLLDMGCRNVQVMTSGNPYSGVVSALGCGNYALYHGNLSVPENEAAAIELVENVFAGLPYRLVLAGHAPTARLRAVVAHHDNVTLVASPDDKTRSRLIAEAHVNVLITGQPTGLKLKLLYSLFAGRFCLVNSNMVAGTDLGGLCTVADGADTERVALGRLMETPFGVADRELRVAGMQPYITANAIRPLLDMLATEKK